ncbi:MAG: NUDIX domain-containing protein [Actinomycetia bacterium]|nr:NUDIX domain-containing protein [Actinomycetes bacterium]
MPDLLVVAATCIHDREGRLLTVRKRGTSRFMLPGGKLEPAETPAQAAVRETAEEVGIDIDPAALALLGHWRAPAANEPDTLIDSTVYTVDLADPAPQIAREIDELRWLEPRRAGTYDDLAPMITLHVLPALA